MEKDIKTMVSEEEKAEVLLLVAELSKICNDKIPIILKKKRLEHLRKFEITTLAVSLQFACDEETFKELKSRRDDKDDKNLTYFG